MSASRKSLLIAFLTVFIVLFIDQFLKIWIKTHIPLIGPSEVRHSFEFKIELLENYGMAWGYSIGGNFGKILLTLLRIVASIVITIYLIVSIRKKAGTYLVIVISLILAGAIGNIIDSMFYGMIFSQSTMTEVARLFPAEGGYSTFFHGKVVDFLSVRVFDFAWPVFNIADSAITIGVLIMLLFQKKLFKKKEEALQTAAPENLPEEPQG